VLHSVEKINELRKRDKDLNRMLNKLTETLSG
jgi:chromosomal replication initiation ATPase DnaA